MCVRMRMQVEALQHVAAVNTAAAFSVHIDERLCAEIECSKARDALPSGQDAAADRRARGRRWAICPPSPS